jgi:hypothetical protein
LAYCSTGNKTIPQSRKKRPHLPEVIEVIEVIEVRLLTRQVKERSLKILTSMTECIAYPCVERVDFYVHRWEIKLVYREMKQHILKSHFTLRRNLLELINQELLSLILAYNLIRY